MKWRKIQRDKVKSEIERNRAKVYIVEEKKERNEMKKDIKKNRWQRERCWTEETEKRFKDRKRQKYFKIKIGKTARYRKGGMKERNKKKGKERDVSKVKEWREKDMEKKYIFQK